MKQTNHTKEQQRNKQKSTFTRLVIKITSLITFQYEGDSSSNQTLVNIIQILALTAIFIFVVYVMTK